MRRTILAAALLTALAVTGCSNNGGTEATADNKPSRKPAVSPSPKQDEGPLKLGQAHHWTDKGPKGEAVSGTVTAIAYTHPDPRIDMVDGVSDYDNPVWVSLEVKGCIDKDSATAGFSQEPWSLAFPDDTRVNAPLISGSGTAKPEYSVQGAVVKPGGCLRGKITFSVEH
ncbi:hypothetical protein GTW43_24845, partial [Streptomyces sp. SID5785]|uniref:hypothetical protein n=1 Tax=Streptomyces sp. SID5785 TaxID=2690309 RepID=UPI0013614482